MQNTKIEKHYTISKRLYSLDRQANSLCYKRSRLLKYFQSEMVLDRERTADVYTRLDDMGFTGGCESPVR